MMFGGPVIFVTVHRVPGTQAGKPAPQRGAIPLIGTRVNSYLFFHGLYNTLGLRSDAALHTAEVTDNGA